MIDLQSFCSDEIWRPTLRQPFSHGEFSYATNGIYAVRVARRAEVPEVEKPKIAETLDAFFARLDGASFKAIDIVAPANEEKTSQEECEDCDGRGKDHECPNCDCTCQTCDGTGTVTKTDHISVGAFGEIYRLPYLRKILAIPGVEIADLSRNYETPEPALFRFDGGVAALMVLRRAYGEHLECRSLQLPSPNCRGDAS